MVRKGKYFVSVPIRRDESEEANIIIEKANGIRWLEDDEVPTCKEYGQKLRYEVPTCGNCKHLFWNRTIKQTIKRTYICGILFKVTITCEILDEDINKPVECPFFEEAQFEEFEEVYRIWRN